MRKRKITTIEDLAVMTQQGFSEVSGEFKKVYSEIDGLRSDMNNRFDRVENILIRAHDNRLDKIEDDIRLLKTLGGQR